MQTISGPRFQELGINLAPTFQQAKARRIGSAVAHSWFDAVEADGSRRAEACTAFPKRKSCRRRAHGRLGYAREVRKETRPLFGCQW